MSTEDVRVSAAKYLQRIMDNMTKQGGVEIRSDSDKRYFTELTGGTHYLQGFTSRQDWLMAKWTSGSKVTTCMEFVIEYAKNLGYTRGIPGGYLGSFYIDKNLDNLKPKKGYAWIPFANDKRPKDGDVVLFNNAEDHEHIGVSVTFNDDTWITLESGQGTIGKFDSIKKKEQAWGSRTMMGWADIDLYFGPAPPPAAPAQPNSGTTGSLWFNDDGDLVHPNAPDGGGGPGFFRMASTLSADPFDDDLPHPWSQAARSLDPLALADLKGDNA